MFSIQYISVPMLGVDWEYLVFFTKEYARVHMNILRTTDSNLRRRGVVLNWVAVAVAVYCPARCPSSSRIYIIYSLGRTNTSYYCLQGHIHATHWSMPIRGSRFISSLHRFWPTYARGQVHIKIINLIYFKFFFIYLRPFLPNFNS